MADELSISAARADQHIVVNRSYSSRGRVASRPAHWRDEGVSYRSVCFAAGSGLWGTCWMVFETGYRGDRGPVIYGPAGISAAVMWRIKVGLWACCREGEADTRRHLDNPRAEFQEPQADGVELGGGERVCLRDRITDGEHEPVGSGVQDQPHLVGERAATAGCGRRRAEPCAA